MTYRCPRCNGATQRIVTRVHPQVGPWAMQVVMHEPLICTRCLTDWALRRVTGTLMLLPPEGVTDGHR